MLTIVLVVLVPRGAIYKRYPTIDAERQDQQFIAEMYFLSSDNMSLWVPPLGSNLEVVPPSRCSQIAYRELHNCDWP